MAPLVFAAGIFVGGLIAALTHVVVHWRRRKQRTLGVLTRIQEGPDKGKPVAVSLEGPALVFHLVTTEAELHRAQLPPDFER